MEDCLNKIQGNSERQFNELWSKMNEQKECFTKDIETIKKKHTHSEILVLKSSIHEIKNELESMGNREDQMDVRISES